MKLKYISIIVLAITPILQSCAPAVIAGGAAGTAAHDRRNVGAFIDDNTLELKIDQAIAQDRALNQQVHVDATGYNGLVLLTGEVPNAAYRRQVLRKVHGFPNIRRVHDYLRIAPPSSIGERSRDTWLTAKVKTAMITANEKLDATRIKVVTSDGAVYLMGLIRREEARLAEKETKRVEGVRRVINLFEYVD